MILAGLFAAVVFALVAQDVAYFFAGHDTVTGDIVQACRRGGDDAGE